MDVPKQMGPASLFQTGVVIVGSIEIADQHPVEGLAQHLVHHLFVPPPADEVPLGGGAEGPDRPVDPVLAPARFIGMHHRTASDSFHHLGAPPFFIALMWPPQDHGDFGPGFPVIPQVRPPSVIPLERPPRHTAGVTHPVIPLERPPRHLASVPPVCHPAGVPPSVISLGRPPRHTAGNPRLCHYHENSLPRPHHVIPWPQSGEESQVLSRSPGRGRLPGLGCRAQGVIRHRQGRKIFRPCLGSYAQGPECPTSVITMKIACRAPTMSFRGRKAARNLRCVAASPGRRCWAARRSPTFIQKTLQTAPGLIDIRNSRFVPGGPGNSP